MLFEIRQSKCLFNLIYFFFQNEKAPASITNDFTRRLKSEVESIFEVPENRTRMIYEMTIYFRKRKEKKNRIEYPHDHLFTRLLFLNVNRGFYLIIYTNRFPIAIY